MFGLQYSDGKKDSLKIEQDELTLRNLVGIDVEEAKDYALDVGITLEIEYQYNSEFSIGKVISQSIDSGIALDEVDEFVIVVSKGEIPVLDYQKYKINELGKVPIMMYHGIVDMASDDMAYVGGNVDKDGYNRTAEAFREDLEFYYNSGYRMVRLIDYVDGIIDVEFGKSPIILTFDDGNENNFKVLGEKDGELVIEPNCAVGILEEFKKKYPDYGVTATFFVNYDLFQQEEYNEDILKWLVEHGYDIGNHTMTHCDFTEISVDDVGKEVGGLYQILESIIPDRYVNIVALPFGSPYTNDHVNYSSILSGTYLGSEYYTKAALRVGWEADNSCFDQEFDPTYLKRIRAYDNNGSEFDIEMNFKLLEDSRYISDGDKDTIVVLKDDSNKVNQFKDKYQVISY